MNDRNIWGELEAMGFEPDDQQYQDAARRDARHQEEKCNELYLKDARDFLQWKRENAPKSKRARFSGQSQATTSAVLFSGQNPNPTK